jgi:hypothetical protein
MPRPPINLVQKLKDILNDVEVLPPEADTPLSHYKRSGIDLGNLLQYVKGNFGLDPEQAFPPRVERL